MRSRRVPNPVAPPSFSGAACRSASPPSISCRAARRRAVRPRCPPMPAGCITARSGRARAPDLARAAAGAAPPPARRRESLSSAPPRRPASPPAPPGHDRASPRLRSPPSARLICHARSTRPAAHDPAPPESSPFATLTARERPRLIINFTPYRPVSTSQSRLSAP